MGKTVISLFHYIERSCAEINIYNVHFKNMVMSRLCELVKQLSFVIS